MSRKVYCLSLAVVFLVVLNGTVVAQQKFLKFNYTHNVRINGQSGKASASGYIDREHGILVADGKIDDYIPGYRFWPVSWLTLKMVSIASLISLQSGDAKNLFTLTGGKLGYQIAHITKDDFADFKTNIQVTLKGDTVAAVLESEGAAKYPDIVSMGKEPVILTQKPNPRGGFTETGGKQLVAADGSVIKTEINAEYSQVKLPSTQQREVSIITLAESEDRRNVSLLIRSVVRPQK